MNTVNHTQLEWTGRGGRSAPWIAIVTELTKDFKLPCNKTGSTIHVISTRRQREEFR